MQTLVFAVAKQKCIYMQVICICMGMSVCSEECKVSCTCPHKCVSGELFLFMLCGDHNLYVNATPVVLFLVIQGHTSCTFLPLRGCVSSLSPPSLIAIA